MNDLKKIVESSLEKCIELKEKMAVAVKQLMAFTSPTAQNFDTLVSTIIELRQKSIEVCIACLRH